ncbi:MAG: DsbA family protein [Hyphomonadaceae bacterium]
MLDALVRSVRSIGAVGTLAALALAGCSGEKTSGPGETVPINPYLEDVMLGDANAPVEMIEYASLACPHCRDFWKQDMPRLKADYIDTGKVKYILRDFPTAPAELSIAAAAIARCTGKDGYFAVVDDVFDNFYELIDAVQSGAGAAPMLLEIGTRHGLTPDEVKSCVNSPRIQSHIDKVVRDAQRDVSGTPTVFINGEKITSPNYESVTAAIDAALGVTAEPSPAAEAPSTGEQPEDEG